MPTGFSLDGFLDVLSQGLQPRQTPTSIPSESDLTAGTIPTNERGNAELLNRNVKSVTQNPDGSRKVDFYDDTDLMGMVGGKVEPLTPAGPNTQPATPQPQTAELQGVNVPTPNTDGGGGAGFLDLLQNGNAMALILGELAQALDPQGTGGRLGAFAAGRAQRDIYSQLFDTLLQNQTGNGGSNQGF